MCLTVDRRSWWRCNNPERFVVSFRQYVSSHGHSIQKTKHFLERESHRLKERQAALQAAQTSSSQDPGLGGPTEERMRTLQQVQERPDSFTGLMIVRGGWLLSLVLLGVQRRGRAAADCSERKLPAEEEGGAAAAAGELHGWRGQEKTDLLNRCLHWHVWKMKMSHFGGKNDNKWAK